ncbi:MAG: hypothetical protein U0R50_13365 [Gaiellales bacterium]
MKRTMPALGLLLVVALFALGTTACGGDDSGSDEATPAESTATTESVAEETTSDETTADETTDETALPDESGTSDECLQLNEAALEVGKAFSSLSGNDPASVKEAAAAFQEFASKAPEAVRGDFETLADTFSAYAELFGDVDLTSGETPDAETLAKIQEFATGDSAKKAQEASERITAWSTEHCGP